MGNCPELVGSDPYDGVDPKRIYTLVKGLGSVTTGFDSPSDSDGRTSWETDERSLADGRNAGRAIRGEDIIELGCGYSTKFLEYCIENGANSYTGVDLFRTPTTYPTGASTNVRYVNGDMAQFLSKQAPNSAVIAEYMVLGAEHIRLTSMDLQKRVMKIVADAIFRVAKPGKPFLSFTFAHACINPSNITYYEQALMNAGFVRKKNDFLYKPE